MTEKKVYEDPQLVTKMNQRLKELESIIENMSEKRGSIFIDWLENHNKYLQWEENFNPAFLRAYRRGEIVLTNFGFNVGTEYGGMHYAVVIRSSTKNNPNLNVVPLSSLDEGVSKENIHKDRVFLGIIEGLNDKRAVAIPDQMRPISKIRVYKPRKQSESVFKITSDQIDLIDDKIRRLYTKL